MKKIYVLWSLALATLMANVFFACKSDDTIEDFFRQHGFTLNPAQNPDFVIYSNGKVLATTLGTRGETRADVSVNENYFKVKDYNADRDQWSDWEKANRAVLYAAMPYAPAETDRGESVSKDEYNFVINYIKEHPDEGGTECDLTTYFIQNVGSSLDTYSSEDYPELIDWNNASHGMVGGNQMDYVVWSNTHINDYNATSGPRALCVNIPLTDPYYRESWGDHSRDIKDAYKFYTIKYNGKTNLYLCFDYRSEKNSKEYFGGDGVYNDWVIKIIPADGSPITTPDEPDDPDEPDEPIIDPIEPVVPVITDEVEVNLSVNDEKEEGDYIATKLSIHIRALTDVEVFIPVKQEYYCDVDDMAIVMSHQLDPNYQYSNPGQTSITNGYTYTYTIAGQPLNVTVTYEANGIRVKTNGVNQAMLDYLQETYQDGVTVEVWNYFNDAIPQKEDDHIVRTPIDRDNLKPMLDQSTVTFTSTEHPAYYVNAFAMLYDYQKNDLHVYMKDGKPYLMDVIYDAAGHIINQTESNTPLDSRYWVANADGTFKEFKGAKNAWDCTVTPPAAYSVETTHTGVNPEDFNVVYKK